MTTGRINQVAFLTDAPAPHDPSRRARPRRRRPSFAHGVERSFSGTIGGRGPLLPTGSSASERTSTRRGPNSQRNAQGASGERNTTGASRSAPRRCTPHRGGLSAGRRNDASEQHDAIGTGKQHKKQTGAGPIADPTTH
jgi:hypothetical protein